MFKMLHILKDICICIGHSDVILNVTSNMYNGDSVK